jgi:hypothetical protein
LTSPAQHSDRTLAAAGQSLVHQRAGGRRTGSIGKRSAELKRRHRLKKALNMLMATVAILVAAMIAGLVIDGIGVTGVLLTGLAIFGAMAIFSNFPRLKVPSLAALNSGDVRRMVGNTELWLEAQRPSLPAPAVQLVDCIGVQLDALGLQLEKVDHKQPAVAQVRALIGEQLPGLVSTYTSIPAHLRSEPRAGRSPDDELTDSLGKISGEIDSITRQLADGQIDKLAVTTRYLDYKYGKSIV